MNHVGARLLRYRRWRGKPQRKNAAELKDKVQTVKKSLEWQQHRNNRRCSKQFNSTRPLKKPGRLQRKKPQLRQAAKEVAERETKARLHTKQKAAIKTTAEAENVSRRTDSFRNDSCRQMPNEKTTETVPSVPQVTTRSDESRQE